MKTKRPVEWLEMPEWESWILRPVMRKMCLYESLKDGTLDLVDIAKMNEALDVEAENERRYREANE